MITVTKRLVRSYLQECKDKPVTVIMETVGVLSSMLASVFISLQLVSMPVVFIVWMLGSVTMAVSSYNRHNLMWLVLSLFYCIMNVIGLITWI